MAFMAIIPSLSSFSTSSAFTLSSCNKIWIQISFSKHFPFTNPYFNTNLSINGLSKHTCIINIHTESMKGHTALFELFTTRNFSSVQTSAQLNLNSFGAHTKGRSNRHLGSAFKVDTVFNLAGNRVSNDHRIQFRSTNLQDVDLHIIFTGQLLQLL